MCFFFFQAEDGIRDLTVTGVQTCALPILRCVSPPSSAPRTLRSVVVPVVTGLGDAAAATAMVGALFWIVTLAEPGRPEPGSVAVMVKGPPALPPAVKSPLESMVPPPLTSQVKVGFEV